ncbi:hypothetical protein TNCV_1153161 [Trichonephila clavipes]|nr:hypothetical protein TNCV_1153161 [Trichonephila clavipes]
MVKHTSAIRTLNVKKTSLTADPGSLVNDVAITIPISADEGPGLWAPPRLLRSNSGEVRAEPFLAAVLRDSTARSPSRQKLTVWCALWAGGIIGPYFFKNDEGHNVTVNGDRYRAMITNFFIPELNNHDVQELWFQQDGATCHTARATIDLLKDTFGDRLISRFGPVN